MRQNNVTSNLKVFLLNLKSFLMYTLQTFLDISFDMLKMLQTVKDDKFNLISSVVVLCHSQCNYYSQDQWWTVRIVSYNLQHAISCQKLDNLYTRLIFSFAFFLSCMALILESTLITTVYLVVGKHTTFYCCVSKTKITLCSSFNELVNPSFVFSVFIVKYRLMC